jgi:hypothetical protein
VFFCGSGGTFLGNIGESLMSQSKKLNNLPLCGVNNVVVQYYCKTKFPLALALMFNTPGPIIS